MAMQVALVPGFGGSTLRYQDLALKLHRIWYSPIQLAKYGPEGLRLSPNGDTPFVPGGLLLFPGPGYEFGIYDQLKGQLVKDGWTVSTFAYDWRKSLQGQANRFATALATVYGNGAFSVVAHSAGGLVAQLAYPVWQALGTGGTWQTTLYLGTPHGGCYWAPAGLGVVVADGWFLYTWLAAFVNAIQGNFPQSLGIGQPSRTRIANAVASWPQLYDLMPNQKGPWVAFTPNTAPLFQSSTWSKSNPAVSQQLLADSLIVQQTLVDALAQPRPAEVVVAGTGYETFGGYVAGGDPGDPDSYVITQAGDGTVPKALAVLPGKTSIVGPWTHTTIVQEDGVVKNVTTWLQNPPTVDVTVDPSPLKGVAILGGAGVNPPGLFIPIPGNPVGPNSLGGVDP